MLLPVIWQFVALSIDHVLHRAFVAIWYFQYKIMRYISHILCNWNILCYSILYIVVTITDMALGGGIVAFWYMSHCISIFIQPTWEMYYIGETKMAFLLFKFLLHQYATYRYWTRFKLRLLDMIILYLNIWYFSNWNIVISLYYFYTL